MKIKTFIIWSVITALLAFGAFKFIQPKKAKNTSSVMNNLKDNKNNSTINKGNPINKDAIGTIVDIECKVLSKYIHKDGHIFLNVIVDSQKLTIPIFNNIDYDCSLIKENSILKVKGKVKEYKGDLQVIPNLAIDIILVKN